MTTGLDKLKTAQADLAEFDASMRAKTLALQKQVIAQAAALAVTVERLERWQRLIPRSAANGFNPPPMVECSPLLFRLHTYLGAVASNDGPSSAEARDAAYAVQQTIREQREQDAAIKAPRV